MSQAGGVTEGESFSVGDGENLPAENTDVSMSDRAMDDILAKKFHLIVVNYYILCDHIVRLTRLHGSI